MKRALVAIVALFAFAFPSVPRASDSTPEGFVKSTVEDVLAAIKQNKDKRALRVMAAQKVVPHFDFAHMTQLAVGRAWRDASADQQQALVEGFRSLLVNTYVSALSQAANDVHVLEVKPVQLHPRQNDATVRTLVREPGKQPIAIDYKLLHGPEGWKVYDVPVENLSLVTNYRGSFAGEINRSGIEGLIRALDAKNRSLAQS
jgi:phospholipid transport system substrate-binding protein